MFKQLENKSTNYISFLQAAGVAFYISLVALLFLNAEKLFGNMPSFLGFIMFPTLFSVSAMICALLTLAYPFWLAWEKKQTKKALKILSGTAFFLFLFFLIILTLIAVF